MNRELVLVNLGNQLTKFSRKMYSLEHLTNVICESYEKSMNHLKVMGSGPSDTPYVAYLNKDMENPDMEHLVWKSDFLQWPNYQVITKANREVF